MLIMKKYLFFIALFTNLMYSQNTIGIIANSQESYNGYTLFAANNSTDTYLINNCGEVINKWIGASIPASSIYLLENGNLLKTGRIQNSNITFGGVGGKIELYDWDSNLLWEYTYSSSLFSQHHDIYPLPNGNILMLAVTTMNQAEAVQAGRDANNLTDGKLFNEQILELEPVGTNQANIVWEWNIKDHLIQDIDATKNNFGIVADNPQLLNINFLNNGNPEANWLHINSIQYNEELDQIILSSRNLSEIYIIDHSTTTTQSASHSGGIYGKGGDFLYRWGNPKSYNKGTENDRVLFSQHYPHWIANGLVDAGKIILFNNGNARGYSSVDIINTPTTSPGEYIYNNIAYGPIAAEWTYTDNPQADFFSSIISSAQRLPNGNTLICEGTSGYFFEINQTNNKVWEYINPDSNGSILSQGDTPSGNFVFRALKFPFSYPAFTGRDLTPSNPIELNPNLSNCNLLNVTEHSLDKARIKLYPNPVLDYLTVDYTSEINSIEIYTIFGKLIKKVNNTNRIKIGNMVSG